MVYETPTTTAVEVQMEGVICDSKKGPFSDVFMLMLLDQPSAPSTDSGTFGDTWTWDE